MVRLTGDAIENRHLLKVSHNADLTSVTISASPRVTDAGIAGLVINAPELTTLSIAGTNVRATYGHFMPDILNLQYLKTLELKGCMIDLQREDSDAEARVSQQRCACAKVPYPSCMAGCYVIHYIARCPSVLVP
jgi:hypothetical protein